MTRGVDGWKVSRLGGSGVICRVRVSTQGVYVFLSRENIEIRVTII